MATITLGNPVSGTFACTSQTGALFDPDVVQVSFVKDHNADDPTASLYEDTITFGGSEPRDNQLTRVSLGVYSFWYTTDRAGRWSVFPRWQHESALPGVMVTQTPCSSYLVTVQPTEHQFVDREAMIPPGGGDQVSVPYATATTGGMLTDAMAVKFDGIPANAQSAAEVGTAISTGLGTALADYSTTTAMGTAISGAITAIPDAGTVRGLITTGAAAAAAVAYYAANWAVTDWYINGTRGNDSNDGSEAHPLATTEELSRRLAVAVPIDHPVTVHIAQGSYGTLAVRVIQSAPACPFDVVGEVAHASIGTITTFSAPVPASNLAAHLVASGVSDWTGYVGRRIDVLSGADAGSIGWIASPSPSGLGVATARMTRFSLPKVSGLAYTPDGKTPSAGVSISLATLPTIDTVSIEVVGKMPAVNAQLIANRGAKIANLDCISAQVSGTIPIWVDGCRLGTIKSGDPIGAPVVSATRCHIYNGFGVGQTLSQMLFEYPLILGSVAIQCNQFATLRNGVSQGVQLIVDTAFVAGMGVFDVSGATSEGIVISTNYTGRAALTSCFGSGNGRCGIQIPRNSGVVALADYLTGTSGDLYLSGSALAIPWTALPWVDGERSGEATLLVSGDGHNAEATSYVDVTVPYVLSTQKMVACTKAFGGTPGFLSAFYVDATTIRIVSSSATDTSVVTWHILPVGDNAAIRS